jgi:hypothetical protein
LADFPAGLMNRCERHTEKGGISHIIKSNHVNFLWQPHTEGRQCLDQFSGCLVVRADDRVWQIWGKHLPDKFPITGLTEPCQPP